MSKIKALALALLPWLKLKAIQQEVVDLNKVIQTMKAANPETKWTDYWYEQYCKIRKSDKGTLIEEANQLRSEQWERRKELDEANERVKLLKDANLALAMLHTDLQTKLAEAIQRNSEMLIYVSNERLRRLDEETK